MGIIALLISHLSRILCFILWGGSGAGSLTVYNNLLLLLKLELVAFFFSEFLISVSPMERLWQATPFLAPKNFFLLMVKYTNRLHQFILQLFSTSVFSVLNFAFFFILFIYLFICFKVNNSNNKKKLSKKSFCSFLSFPSKDILTRLSG